MGARFAGSQRLGDRRRRRLAVETDDLTEDAAGRRSLPAPSASRRSLESAHADDQIDAPHLSFDRALRTIVPRQWWKYLIGGLASLAIATGLVMAGAHAPSLAAALGPGVERLLAYPEAPVARWFSSLLLAVSAQGALLIWWARSHSHKDFDGRYWLWIRVSCGWVLFSGCVATGAAGALTSILQYLWPQMSDRTAVLGWLVPASAAGSATLITLVREMRGCRWSCALLLLGALAYTAAAVLHVELASRLAFTAGVLSPEASLLAGHVAIFLSMWLHARHVLYFSVDPERPAAFRWRIPRPHFRWPRLARNRTQPTEGQPGNSAAAHRQRPARRNEGEAGASTVREHHAAAAPVAGQAAPPRKPHVRIDLAQEPPAADADGARSTTTNAGAPNRTSGGDSGSGQAIPLPQAARPEAVPAVDDDSDAGSASQSNEADSSPDGTDEAFSKPDMRGLSKKQRRRLMQELRERERTAGR